MIQAAKAGDWSEGPDGVVCGGVALQAQEYTLDTVVEPGDGSGHDVGAAAGRAQAVAVLEGASLGTARGAGGFVVLDTTVTPEATAVGLARDVIREVQKARRDADLAVTDRIAAGARLGRRGGGRGPDDPP